MRILFLFLLLMIRTSCPGQVDYMKNDVVFCDSISQEFRTSIFEILRDSIERKSDFLTAPPEITCKVLFGLRKELNQDSATQQIIKIEGILIIHRYNKDGHSTSDERYVADFKKVGNCYFPKTVKYFPIGDKVFLRPRIIAEIEYELH